MNLFTPSEIVLNYASAGKVKTARPLGEMLALSVLAGMFIAFGAAAANSATHAIGNVSAARVVSGLLFPFGLGMIMLLGAELFTGNCLISISVMNGDVSPGMMARNWFFVYIGNFAGAALIAAGCAFFGHLDQSRSLLLHTIKIAAAKCGISFQYGFVMGIFCNVLVCGGVLCSLSAKDAIGRVAGAYIPVALFVICGFEHSIANMYYVPAGIFAASSSEYAQLAYDAGIATSTLSWGNFFLRNLVPVTAGNITGGALTGFIMWRAHVKAK